MNSYIVSFVYDDGIIIENYYCIIYAKSEIEVEKIFYKKIYTIFIHRDGVYRIVNIDILEEEIKLEIVEEEIKTLVHNGELLCIK